MGVYRVRSMCVLSLSLPPVTRWLTHRGRVVSARACVCVCVRVVGTWAVTVFQHRLHI